jgi:hypothetical protein
MAVVRRQQSDRALDVAAVRDDLAIARSRTDRFSARLGKARPGTKSAANIERAISTNAATVRSLEDLVRDLGDG